MCVHSWDADICVFILISASVLLCVSVCMWRKICEDLVINEISLLICLPRSKARERENISICFLHVYKLFINSIFICSQWILHSTVSSKSGGWKPCSDRGLDTEVCGHRRWVPTLFELTLSSTHSLPHKSHSCGDHESSRAQPRSARANRCSSNLFVVIRWPKASSLIPQVPAPITSGLWWRSLRVHD